MKKNLSSIFLSVTLICNFVYAETIKSSDKNSTMSDEEFMKQFMTLDQQIELEKKKQFDAKAKTEKMKQKSDDIRKLGKTLDELEKQLVIKE